MNPKKKLLFLHGFMGAPEDGDFLKSLPCDFAAFPIPHSAPFDLAAFYQDILTYDPDMIYGYSLGGRVALDFLNKHPEFKPELLILESAGMPLREEEARLKRLALDRQRAQDIRQDFSSFLHEWYALPLWGPLSREDQESRYKEKYDRWQQRPDDLAATIEFYSPGSFQTEATRKDIKTLYLYGELDLKYKNLAQTLADSYECHGIKNVGHCLHKSPRVQDILDLMIGKL